jgi:hypothetical protein
MSKNRPKFDTKWHRVERHDISVGTGTQHVAEWLNEVFYAAVPATPLRALRRHERSFVLRTARCHAATKSRSAGETKRAA